MFEVKGEVGEGGYLLADGAMRTTISAQQALLGLAMYTGS